MNIRFIGSSPADEVTAEGMEDGILYRQVDAPTWVAVRDREYIVSFAEGDADMGLVVTPIERDQGIYAPVGKPFSMTLSA